MKKSAYAYSVSIIFLISLISVVSLLVRPLINTISSKLEQVQNSYISLLEESIGLSVSYDSLSPSIFSGIRMANIEVFDVDDTGSSVSIDSIKLQWNILKLFSEDPTDALGNLIITGFKVDYNYLEENGVVQKILEATQSSSGDPVDETVLLEENDQAIEEELRETIINVINPIFSLPIDVQLKNTTLTYSGETLDAQVYFSKINIFDQSSKEYINLSLSGRVMIGAKEDFESFGDLAIAVGINGRITNELENSFAQINISSIQDSDYIIQKLDMHTSYANRTLTLVAMQNVLPFSIETICNFSSNQLSVAFNAENFEPFSLISYQGTNELLQDLQGTAISGAYTFNYHWDTQDISYDVKGSTLLSENIVGEAINVQYVLYGDESTLAIESFEVVSKTISAEYTGNLALETLIPQGILTINSITVPSGNTLSSEIFLDSLGNELLIFAPQVHLGDKTLTAFHLDVIRNNDSLDFSFEISDYSRTEASNPGVISANGSYVFTENPFFQIEVLSDSLYLGSITEMLLWYLPNEQAQAVELINDTVAPYIFSFNAFFSTDLNSYSYSLPYAIIANTQRDDELLLFSANGNESLFQLPSFNLLAGGQSIQLDASADLGDLNSEIFFNSSVFVNSIPYAFSGVFMPNQYITVSGDYGLNVSMNFLGNQAFSAVAQTQSLPIAFDNILLSLSFDTAIEYSRSTDWLATISALNIESVSSTSILNPRVSFIGNVNPNGAFFDRVIYSDDLSTLEGILASSWNINNSILENLTFNVSLEDSFSNEKYEANIEAFNLTGSAFSDNDFLENMFFSADALIQDSPSGRFANFQTENNVINAQFTAQGSLSNPSATLFVDNASFLLGPQKTMFSGSIILEDSNITANDVDIVLGDMAVENINGSVSINDFEGNLSAVVAGSLGSDATFSKKTFYSPVTLSLTSLIDNANLPLNEKSFELSLVLNKITSTFIPELENYSFNLVRIPGRYDFNAGINSELQGYLLDSGEINISAKEGFFVQFEGSGIVENSELLMYLDDIYTDASYFSNLVDLSVFSLHSGIVEGSGTLTGPLSDLQINAELLGTNMEVSIPDFVNEHLICESFPVTVNENIFSSQNAYFVAQETQTGVDLDIELSLEQLIFTYLSLHVATLDDNFVLGRYWMPYGSFEGLATVDLNIYLGSDLLEVTGDINAKDLEAIITLADEADVEALNEESSGDVVVDLYLTIDNQSQLYFPSKSNPLIRGLVNQTEPLIVQLDSRYETSLISGEFDMRGGEILYLNRTFFARDASAVFNESIEEFDPRLTASAEIRERDVNGDPVRIILSIENQRLSQLDPSFDSIPNMSEQDIMTLLGQVFLGSSEEINPIAILGGLLDYGTQFAVFRGIEDSARDFLNVDIFSLRSMFIQNAILNEVDTTATDTETGTTTGTLTVGDILDSTTIYIGKFLNETLYADAMVSLVYDEERQDLGLGGLVFQPEFGLELPSPFATIRWGIAPDLTTDWNLLVPFTSISLSWKFDL